jgi:hypothetical protein
MAVKGVAEVIAELRKIGKDIDKTLMLLLKKLFFYRR